MTFIKVHLRLGRIGFDNVFICSVSASIVERWSEWRSSLLKGLICAGRCKLDVTSNFRYIRSRNEIHVKLEERVFPSSSFCILISILSDKRDEKLIRARARSICFVSGRCAETRVWRDLNFRRVPNDSVQFARYANCPVSISKLDVYL